MILQQKLRLLGLLASTALATVACEGRNTSFGLDGGSAPLVTGSNTGTNGSSGAGGANGTGTNGTGGAGGASGTGGTSGTGVAGATGATGATGPAGTNGTNGTNGNAVIASNPLGGVLNANVAGVQVGGSPAPVTASILGTTPAANSAVSLSALSGPGNQVQGLLTNVSTTLTNPGTLTGSLAATTAPILGAAGTLPVVSDLLGGLLPSGRNGTPLASLNVGGTQILGNSQSASLLHAAALSPNAVAGSPITANILSGGTAGGLLGGLPVAGGLLGGSGGGALAPVTGLVGGLTGGGAGGALAPVTNLVGGLTGGTAGGGVLAPVTSTVNGLVGGLTGSRPASGATNVLAPVTSTVNGLLGGVLGGLRR